MSQKVYRKEVFERYKASGLSQPEFCKQNNLSNNQFQYRLYERNKALKAQALTVERFETISVTPHTTTPHLINTAIHLPNKIRCDAAMTLQDLSSLLSHWPIHGNCTITQMQILFLLPQEKTKMSLSLKIKSYGNRCWSLPMKKDKSLLEDNISKIMNDPLKVTQIIQTGIRDALLKHKQAGNQICVWKDNRVVWIPPEKLLLINNSYRINSIWNFCVRAQVPER